MRVLYAAFAIVTWSALGGTVVVVGYLTLLYVRIHQ